MTDDTRARQRLEYMSQSIQRIEEYIRDGEEAFLSTPIIQDAVLRRLETLADAAHHLPDEVRARYPAVPWRQIYAFRNLAAHAYEFISMDRIWEIIRDHLPSLASAVADELASSPVPTSSDAQNATPTEPQEQISSK